MNACNACGGWLGPDSGRSYTTCRECIVKRAEQAERERDEARAKVERLRAALRDIVDCSGVTIFEPNGWLMAKIARAALEDSK